MTTLELGSQSCGCREPRHAPRFVVLTGGPGAGKTAVLELARRSFCPHVAILPEAAGIVFGGGFPRDTSHAARCAAQRAIFHVQREVETLVLEESKVAVALCDRGTVDGLAYWPDNPDSYWSQARTSFQAETSRYATVIHLETPGAEQGYNHENALRIESANEARAIDQRILSAWSGHPNRVVVPSSDRFEEKALKALALVRAQLPACCHAHELTAPLG